MPRHTHSHAPYTGPPIIVPHSGPLRADVMVVGERPGYDEAFWHVNGVHRPTPFVGPSGEEQDIFLRKAGIERRFVYFTNLVKTYTGGANPTQEEVHEWEGELYKEIAQVRPKFVLSVGAHSTRWFLGDTDMETVHGLPQRSHRAGLEHIVIIPCFHPAYGLRDNDAKPLVYWDYQQAGKIINKKLSSVPIVDNYPSPQYVENDIHITATQAVGSPFAIDTEGVPGKEWGFSISFNPGCGTVFRRGSKGFAQGVRFVREVGQKSIVVMHNSMYDLEMLRGMGIDLRGCRLYDTMVAAFFLRIEPQALKTLARRHCGMEMRTYDEVIGDAAKEKHIDFLLRALSLPWASEKNETRSYQENDGTWAKYTPQPLNKRVEAILTDHYEDKRDKENNPVDLRGRWRSVDAQMRRRTEQEIGEWPEATLDDIDLQDAIRYSGRDPDATLRVYGALAPRITALQLQDRLRLDLDILPIFEEMQYNGIPASRPYFESLSTEMWGEMMRIGGEISTLYNNGEPFNPMSQPQVSALAASRNLKGAKKTKTGKVSTAKKSMEHLRTVDDAMDKVFTWREHEKVKDSFADPILERMPDGVDYHPIRCNIKITRVAQDRISASDPNLTAMPVASELGRRVREGFRVHPDSEEVFVTGDMSQIEMRVMADLSQDPAMCQFFKEGRDIHSETCIKIFGLTDIVPELKDGGSGEWAYPGMKKDLRNPTKRAGFGVITGISGQGLYDQIRMFGVDIPKFCATMGDSDPVKACNNLISQWFAVYPGCKEFLKSCGDRAYHDGFIREAGGFIRYLPGVWSVDEYTRAEARRQSHSHVISGTAQWMLRKGMRWLAPQIEELRASTGLPVKWLMQIHDEVLFLAHKDLAPIVADLLKEALTKHSGEMSIPIGASTAIATTWGSLEK